MNDLFQLLIIMAITIGFVSICIMAVNYMDSENNKDTIEFIRIPRYFPLGYNESSIGQPQYNFTMTIDNSQIKDCPRRVYDSRGNKLNYYCGMRDFDDKIYVNLLEYYPEREEYIIVQR